VFEDQLGKWSISIEILNSAAKLLVEELVGWLQKCDMWREILCVRRGRQGSTW
jgi:hypothetical protein